MKPTKEKAGKVLTAIYFVGENTQTDNFMHTNILQNRKTFISSLKIINAFHIFFNIKNAVRNKLGSLLNFSGARLDIASIKIN